MTTEFPTPVEDIVLALPISIGADVEVFAGPCAGLAGQVCGVFASRPCVEVRLQGDKKIREVEIAHCRPAKHT